jgi:HlyD family secretion protein
MTKRAIIIAITIFVALFIGGIIFVFGGGKVDPAKYRTQAVEYGDIAQIVSANGTVNPVTLVNVGTQVSGTIKKLYVDFNSVVKKGDRLAELDPALLQAQLAQSQGALANAQAALKLAEINLKRNRELIKKDFIAQSDLDQAEEKYAVAKAQVQKASGKVGHDKTNLEYSVITSPLDGIVVSRNVDIGQTVAASFQTPTLFSIAEDLSKMQIITSVSEADVGVVKNGQEVNFTVDAYRDKKFRGVVSQIRLNASSIQNVVTYNVVVDVKNDEGILLPGMTAFVDIIIDKKSDVLKVPNAALSFRPSDIKPELRKRGSEYGVYVVGDGRLALIKLEIGISDGKFTEVKGGDIKADDQVIVEEINKIGPQYQGKSSKIKM